MPRWVLDYVLLHELAHLLHAGHGPEFWAVLDAYPRTLRARGFLEGYAYAAERGAHAPSTAPEADDGEVDDDGIEEPDDVVADEVDIEDFPSDDVGAVGQLELELDDLGSERRG
jgi:hypothetical protein